MVKKPKGVIIKVDEKFFENIFEKERKRLEKQKGMRLSQMKFTAFLEKNKIKLNPPKMDDKFFPKPLRRRRL